MQTTDTTNPQKGTFDYCLDFWKDALDPEDAIDQFLREVPRHVRAADDVA
jgi:hypothetical protein